ncbi:acyl-CoA/acyl-ACP dehydrogenase [Mycobacterium sp. CVI_P3]|uniref:Acyl-CoA/acyl-ACP dehydrogenase n=1 Tax=Mycobacterium pinniadriaticum TaxID=2994102 RepID=A0ABT3SAV8_9MYCO|nr:acyl-CoA dehydrogenase family protein [Mycobacterium pinniadriaticum]MCX2930098.1 acyl-CoA/acyl-ACP dehydrogenase [Mycobacterium pinniadriaticum]MCX2936253.1 acyl-CoA/acyl-ACP dehydrogenase [Mycobacterium pinniadriaticum]
MSEFADELTGLVRDLAKDAAPARDGQLPDIWPKVQELGLAGIGIAEEAGGSGGELDDLLVVIRELARAGIDTPIVEAATAAFAIGPSADGRFDTVVLSAEAGLDIVTYAPSARRAVVVGASDIAVFELAEADIDSLIDIAGRPAGRVRLGGASVTHPAISADAVSERLALARSASLIGLCWGAYDLTKRYVVDRHQFGAPLIKISAVSTNVAHMVVGIRMAESALRRAVAASSDPGATELRRFGAAASARIAAAQCATAVARTAHQLHGAVGITTEYGLHSYTRALWAQRDADESELHWCGRLGAAALDVDEDAFWDQLTA